MSLADLPFILGRDPKEKEKIEEYNMPLSAEYVIPKFPPKDTGAKFDDSLSKFITTMAASDAGTVSDGTAPSASIVSDPT